MYQATYKSRHGLSKQLWYVIKKMLAFVTGFAINFDVF